VRHEYAHLHALQFRVTVVELKHEWIALAAVDAWMLQQILDQAAQILIPVSGTVPVRVGDIRGPIPLIVLPVPCVLAVAAERMTPILCPVLEVELGQRLHGSTPAAASRALANHGS
jgi:hypothetical protein